MGQKSCEKSSNLRTLKTNTAELNYYLFLGAVLTGASPSQCHPFCHVQFHRYCKFYHHFFAFTITLLSSLSSLSLPLSYCHHSPEHLASPPSLLSSSPLSLPLSLGTNIIYMIVLPSRLRASYHYHYHRHYHHRCHHHYCHYHHHRHYRHHYRNHHYRYHRQRHSHCQCQCHHNRHHHGFMVNTVIIIVGAIVWTVFRF